MGYPFTTYLCLNIGDTEPNEKEPDPHTGDRVVSGLIRTRYLSFSFVQLSSA